MDVLKFSELIGKLKKIKRSGWVREGIKNSESVAEHSFGLSVLCMVLADQLAVDRDKLVKMAIIHDLGEIKTGDLIIERAEGIDLKVREEKESLEKEAIVELFKDFGKSDYKDLFQEIIERKTRESKIFWQLDKLEMIIQAMEYEKEQNLDLSEFFENAAIYIDDSFLKKVIEEILNSRSKK